MSTQFSHETTCISTLVGHPCGPSKHNSTISPSSENCINPTLTNLSGRVEHDSLNNYCKSSRTKKKTGISTPLSEHEFFASEHGLKKMPKHQIEENSTN